MKKSKSILIIAIVLLLIYLLFRVVGSGIAAISNKISEYTGETLSILSSYENKSVEDEVINYAKSIHKKVKFTYLGDLDIVDELNYNASNYDAVWISNSMWLYMLDNTYLTTDSKSISISPVVFGIKKSKAVELGLVDKDVTNDEILNLIKNKKMKYVMSSVTQTNTGATAYLGFLSALAGNPEVLTEDMLEDQELEKNLKDLFSGVARVSGDEDYLEEMFLNNDDYEAVIAQESSLIDINKVLEKQKKETLYLLYPTDGVAVNDSTFAFINNDSSKEETFLNIQSYLLSDEGQRMLEENGVRTWYGGVSDTSNKDIFKTNWGIDTTKYLNVTKFPSKKVITVALNLYIEEFRKPTHVVFCLDYSGSMYGSGEEELKNAMNYILNEEEAKLDKLQFSKSDKITIVTFSSKINHVLSTDNGYETDKLIDLINNSVPGGQTALYDAIIKAIEILDSESDDYTKTVISMTDGLINVGSYDDLKNKYKKLGEEIPIYSITFGSASEKQLKAIAELSNAKVFDGKTDLLKAFKDVRGYN